MLKRLISSITTCCPLDIHRARTENQSECEGNHTGIICISTHLQTPGKGGIVVELLIAAVEEAFRSNIDAFEGNIIEAGA